MCVVVGAHGILSVVDLLTCRFYHAARLLHELLDSFHPASALVVLLLLVNLNLTLPAPLFHRSAVSKVVDSFDAADACKSIEDVVDAVGIDVVFHDVSSPYVSIISRDVGVTRDTKRGSRCRFQTQ